MVEVGDGADWRAGVGDFYWSMKCGLLLKLSLATQ
jgi:hypothetical protein